MRSTVNVPAKPLGSRLSADRPCAKAYRHPHRSVQPPPKLAATARIPPGKPVSKIPKVGPLTARALMNAKEFKGERSKSLHVATKPRKPVNSMHPPAKASPVPRDSMHPP